MGVLEESRQLDEGEITLGTRFRDAFEDHGHRIELDAEVVRYQPGACLEIWLVSDGFESTSRTELAELSGRTRVAVTIDTEYKKRFARMMAAVVTRHAQRQLERDLAALKDLLEEGPAPHAETNS